MKKNSLTEAGHNKHANDKPSKDEKDSLVDALNQAFAIFRRNYHNQYYKAFPNEQELNLTKRLWLDSLHNFSAETVAKATKAIIQSSEFLPSLRSMIKHCEITSKSGFPDAHTAYLEACRANSPKVEYSWSHPIVYYAGKATDWYFLSTAKESVGYPIFKSKYEELCHQVSGGASFSLPKVKALPETIKAPIDKEQSLKHLNRLKSLVE